jgi:hypothetical protein
MGAFTPHSQPRSGIEAHYRSVHGMLRRSDVTQEWGRPCGKLAKCFALYCLKKIIKQKKRLKALDFAVKCAEINEIFIR